MNAEATNRLGWTENTQALLDAATAVCIESLSHGDVDYAIGQLLVAVAKVDTERTRSNALPLPPANTVVGTLLSDADRTTVRRALNDAHSVLSLVYHRGFGHAPGQAEKSDVDEALRSVIDAEKVVGELTAEEARR